MEFRPNWDATGTSNVNRVVPDLFIRFSEFDLIVEAKRWDSFQQNSNQWQNQITAYANEYGNDQVPVCLIALGGIWDTKDDEVVLTSIRCPVHMCRWERLLTECEHMQKETQRLEYLTSQGHAHDRILTDLIAMFACHGYMRCKWFADFHFEQNSMSPSISSHLQLFQKRSKELFL